MKDDGHTMTEEQISLVKRATGIHGLDAVTRGGLPRSSATLVIGDPGCGKTVLGLQILARAAERGEGGVMVSFEESRAQVLRDAGSFSWGPVLEDAAHCEIVDARRNASTHVSGSFDIDGLLAALGGSVERLNATWIVLDGIDQLLRLQPDTQTAVDQVVQINQWCEDRGLTMVITGKSTRNHAASPDHLAGIEFMLSTVIVLSTRVAAQRLHRQFRIAKYRGTGHVTDEVPLVIDDGGIHLPHDTMPDALEVQALTERVGTGVSRLDDVLDGGVYRGSTTLISGQPGTAKTSFAAAFAQAAAERGERVLFISFDEFAAQIVRNVGTVGIDLQPHIDSGQLMIHARAAWTSLVEEHFLAVRRLIETFAPQCLVIDPASALLKASDAESAFEAIERLITRTRTEGITTVLTSLTENDDPVGETTLSHTSTLADTWIVLRYAVHGGERNRALSVVKSRGTSHSNQVREVLMSSGGLELADVFQYGSEVLMGTARLQRESEESTRRRQQHQERSERRRQLQKRIDQARAEARQAGEEVEHLLEAMQQEDAAVADSDRDRDLHQQQIVRRREAGRSDRGGASGHEGDQT